VSSLANEPEKPFDLSINSERFCEQAFTPKKAETEAPLFFSELKRHGITSAAVYRGARLEATKVWVAGDLV
jgi:hypothetical protein